MSVSTAGVLGVPAFGCDDAGQQRLRYRFFRRWLQRQNYNEDYYLTAVATAAAATDVQDADELGTPLKDDFVQDPDGESRREVRSLRGFGDFVGDKCQNRAFQVYFAAYPGTAAIYTALADYTKPSFNGTRVVGRFRDDPPPGVQVFTSAYVSSASYGCSLSPVTIVGIPKCQIGRAHV